MEYKDLERINGELDGIDVKGKEYVEVNQRVLAFRKLYPEGSIETNIVHLADGVCVIKAEAFADTSNDNRPLGSGIAYETEGSTFINKTSYIENCETSAVGRALGFVGIGIDKSIASKEEVANAKLNQNKETNKTAKKVTEQDRPRLLEELCEAIKNNPTMTTDKLCSAVGIEKIADLSTERLPGAINYAKDTK